MRTQIRGRLLGLCFAAAMLVTICTTAREARAQGPCEEQWLAGEGVPGVIGQVNAMTMWDPDGNGPVGPRVVIGGNFILAGDVIANHIAAWDPATGEWFAFNQGFDYHVLSLAVTADGELIVGGRFTQTANHVARWDQSTGEWSSIGSGVGYNVYALAVMPNGDVVAGGQYDGSSDPPDETLKRWNSSNWVSMGFDPLHFNTIRALLVLPNGDLIVAGYFLVVPGVTMSRGVVRWNGTAWTAVGTGLANGSVLEFELLPDGTFLAVGDFDTADGAPSSSIARWDGSAWTSVGGGISGSISTVELLPNGEIVVAGSFSLHNRVARWNGSEWLPLGSGIDDFIYEFVVLPNGELLMGGGFYFHEAGGVPVRSMAKWNSATEQWSNLGAGMNDRVWAALTLPNGDLIAGGFFRAAGDIAANFIARQERATGQWHPLGTGMNAVVRELFLLPNGDVIASGEFTFAGGIPAAGLARWDGASWSAMGAPPAGTSVRAVMPDGNLVVGRDGALFLWDGSSWSQQIGTFAIGSGGSLKDVEVVHVLPNGDLIAGGTFTRVNGAPINRIARRSYATETWSSLGSGITGTGLNAIASLPDGNIIAGGGFDSAGGVAVNGIARWDGNAWHSMGAEFDVAVYSLLVQPDGDVIAGGYLSYSSSSPMRNIARWNGSEWSPLGAGVNASVRTLAAGAGDEFIAIGDVTRAGTHVSAFFARWGVPEDCCRADFDGNGAREVPDIFAFLSAWLAHGQGADFDGNGAIAVADVYAFLGEWFAGC